MAASGSFIHHCGSTTTPVARPPSASCRAVPQRVVEQQQVHQLGRSFAAGRIAATGYRKANTSWQPGYLLQEARDGPRTSSSRIFAASSDGAERPSSADGGGGGAGDGDDAEAAPGSSSSTSQQAPIQRRLVTLIRSVPDRLRLYFRRRPLRQWMWIVITYGLGHYTANSTTLAFGTLAVNDVIAGACSVLFVEVVTYLFYRTDKPALYLTLLNSFKIGFTAALISDAMKLGGIIIGK